MNTKLKEGKCAKNQNRTFLKVMNDKWQLADDDTLSRKSFI